MPSKELIEKVARAIIENPPKINRLKDMETLNFSKVVDHTPTAEAVISTIRAALLEDRYLHEIIESYFNMPHGRGYGKDRLSVFLAASALGEQSDG